MNLDELSFGLSSYRRQLDREAGEARHVASLGKKVAAEVEKLQAQKEALERAAAVLTSIGEERQQQAQLRIEALVTHGLQAIFGEDLSFHMVQSVQRNQANVDFIVRSRLADGRTVDTPVMDARGGGVAVVVGFLLRLVVMLLSPQRQDPVLFLDETFAMLSRDYLPACAEFLRELVDKTPVQIVMVTHQEEFMDCADVVHRFSLEDGTTVVRPG